MGDGTTTLGRTTEEGELMKLLQYLITLTVSGLLFANAAAADPALRKPTAKRPESAIAAPDKRLDVLIDHLRLIIRDETNQVEPAKLKSFVRHYQDRAVAAGLLDIDRQTQYVILALYTSGKGVDHPACRTLMMNPPKESDAFADAMQALPDAIWETGIPIWDSQVYSASKSSKKELNRNQP